MKTALTYDDIQLVPSLSKVKSRNDITLKTLVSRRYGLLNPFVASPMDTICEKEMAFKMFLLGGVGCIHRFMSIEEQSEQVNEISNTIKKYLSTLFSTNFNNKDYIWKNINIEDIPIMAIGVQEDDKGRALSLVNSGANILLIDVAHGHHENVLNMVRWCKSSLPHHIDIIAGNIVTADAAIELEIAGADGLRVGLGGGCFTPNMSVRTNKGLKKIKDIEIGDEVYTHTGELKPVINTFTYENYKEIIDIDGIEATPNHKFYVVHKNKIDLINDNNIHNYAEWVKAEDLTDDYFLIEID